MNPETRRPSANVAATLGLVPLLERDAIGAFHGRNVSQRHDRLSPTPAAHPQPPRRRPDRESHGLVAHTMIEVDGRIVSEFLGKVHEPSPGEPWVATAFRTILFTDMEGSTSLTQQHGTPGRSTSCGLTTGSFGTPYSDTAAPRWTMRATASWRRSSRS